jgi:hypothetical protein
MNWENARGLRTNLGKLSAWQKYRIKNHDVKVLVARERREGWRGELPFYIFWCGDCGDFSYDYAHGHIDRRYLNCHRCNGKVDFVPWWVMWRMLWEVIRARFSLRAGRK